MSVPISADCLLIMIVPVVGLVFLILAAWLVELPSRNQQMAVWQQIADHAGLRLIPRQPFVNPQIFGEYKGRPLVFARGTTVYKYEYLSEFDSEGNRHWFGPQMEKEYFGGSQVMMSINNASGKSLAMFRFGNASVANAPDLQIAVGPMGLKMRIVCLPKSLATTLFSSIVDLRQRLIDMGESHWFIELKDYQLACTITREDTQFILNIFELLSDIADVVDNLSEVEILES